MNYLKSLAGPLPDFLVCPTGGIKAEIAGNYLACPNVVCVGGSWIASGDLLAQGDYAEIEARARHAGLFATVGSRPPWLASGPMCKCCALTITWVVCK